MNKKDIKLICSDIDGTLITSNDEMPDNFDEILNKLKDLGIIFVAASGRGIASIKAKLNSDLENLYYISDNGAILQHNGEIFYKNSFSKDEVNEIMTAFRHSSEATIIATTEEMSYAEKHPSHSEDFLKEFYVKYEIVEDITKLDKEFVKVTMRSDHHSDENYNLPQVNNLKNSYHLVRAGHPWIDIMHANSNKGNALEALMKRLDIDPSQTIGFGDFPNDIHMLEVVGKSYAMANAHPDVKKISDEIIGSNDENSVMKKIIELLDL